MPMQGRYEDLLRRLAVHDERVLGSVLAMPVACDVNSGLATKTQAAVRLAGCVATQAAPQSYEWSVSAYLDAGATLEDVVGVLIALGSGDRDCTREQGRRRHRVRPRNRRRATRMRVIALSGAGGDDATVAVLRSLVFHGRMPTEAPLESSHRRSADTDRKTRAMVVVAAVVATGGGPSDSKGPLARLERQIEYPDFAFVQHVNPDLAPPGWRPSFIDYLYLGFTTSIAFSPTDVMPLASWAKAAMTVQSTVSFIVIGLVIARAVNVLA